jgi:prophage regulatory protein
MTTPATPTRQLVTVADLTRFGDDLIKKIQAILDGSRPSKHFLRMERLVDKVGLSRATIQDKVSAGEFPAPITLGGRAVGFLSIEVDKWMDEHVAASRRNGPAMRAARTPIAAQRAHEERKKRVAGTRLRRDGQARAAVPTEHQVAP